MRIGVIIDILSSFCSSTEVPLFARSGIEVYLYELLKAVSSSNQQHQFYLIRTRPMPGPLPEEIQGRVVEFPWRSISSYARHSAAWREWVAVRYGLDIVHEVTPNEPFWHCSRYPLVVTVHDVMPLLYPQWFTLKNRTSFKLFCKSNLNRARKIICVSQHTATDLLTLMPHLAPKIRVIPIAGQNLPYAADATVLANYGVNRPYILNVSTIEPRKGHVAMFEAMKALKARGYPHQLVCAGSLGWHTGEIMNHPYYLANRGDIILTGTVDEATLKCLYENAELFLYPSLYEGFGIPPLEAMQAGLPVIASRNSSLPEVLGDAAYYLGPDPDAQEIITALTDLLSSPSKTQHYQSLSLEQAKRFSWQHTAAETLRVYEELE